MNVALRSPLLEKLGVRHGFSTRLGGVSDGPFSALNVAVAPGDRPEAVAENLRRFAHAIELDPSSLYQTSQVHGSQVREIVATDAREAVLHEEADALVSRDRTCAVGVRIADCVPVLVYDEASGHVAAIHAGWRGVVAGVVPAGIAALVPYGSPRTLVAAIGPCIGPCCFEVGDEVVNAIESTVPDDGTLVHRGNDKPHVDLRRAVRLQLCAIGLDPSRIDDSLAVDSGCTRCDATRFFSFRRDGARSGRHLAAIAPR